MLRKLWDWTRGIRDRIFESRSAGPKAGWIEEGLTRPLRLRSGQALKGRSSTSPQAAHQRNPGRSVKSTWRLFAKLQPCALGLLEGFIAAGRSEVQGEGIAGQIHGNAIVCRQVHRRGSDGSHPRDRDVFRRERDRCSPAFLITLATSSSSVVCGFDPPVKAIDFRSSSNE